VDVFDLFAKISLDTSEYESGLSTASKITSNFGSKIQSALGLIAGATVKIGSTVGGAFTQVAGAMIDATKTAAVEFAESSVDVGQNFDKAMSQVAATLGYSVKDLKNPLSEVSQNFSKLRDFAQDMGANTAFSAQQAAEGLNILAMAGLSVDEQMTALPDVLNLAAAGALTLEQAASYTAGAVKGFSDSMENAQYYTDLIAKGATLANTDVAGLGEALGRSAATAKTYGQEADSVTLSLLRLADQNVTGEAAATALNRAMADLYTPTEAAQKALKALGVSAYTSTGKARDFNEVVADLKGALSGMTDEQANAYAASVFTTQGLSAFNKMTAASTETMDKFTKGLEDVSDSAAQQAATQLDNLAGNVTLFQSALEGAQIALSDQLTPTLQEFVQFGTDGLTQLTEAFKEGGLSGVMDTFGTVLNDGLNMITSKLPEFTDAGAEIISTLGEGLVDNLPAITDTAVKVILMLADGLIEADPQIIDAAFEVMLAFFRGLSEALPELLPKIGELMIAIAEGIVSHLPEIIAVGLQIVAGLALGLVQAIPELLLAIPKLIGALIDGFCDLLGIHSPSTVFAEMGDNIIAGLLEGISNKWDSILEFFSGAVKDIKGVFSGAPDWFKNIGKNMLEGLWNGISDKVGWLKAQVSGVVNKIKSWFTGKKGFDTHSPSKWGAQVGNFLTQGLSGGIESGLPALMQRVDSMTAKIKDGLDFGTNVKSFENFDYGPLVDYPASEMKYVENNQFEQISRAIASAVQSTNGNAQPITIVVQPVLDGRVLGESAYKYMIGQQKAYRL